jgi:ribosomal-protein-alanine N-acetyltransferase
VARIERSAFSAPWSRDAFRAHLGDLFLVAEGQDGIAGFLVARRVGAEAEILDIAVAGDARGRGVGHGLVETALGALAADGVRDVYLEVRVSNAAARQLYRRAGFLEAGRRPGYYAAPPEDALVLRRRLRPGDTAA